MKKLIIALYTLIIVCIGLATVIEKLRGTSFVSEYIYGAWWFSALWALLTVSACAYILKQRLYRRIAVMLLHLAFVVILAGALTTHLFARRGTIGLRTDNPVMSYIDEHGHPQPLPFTLTLSSFRIVNYPGTDAPLDYQSVIQCDNGKDVTVSMNHIGQIDGYRLFQSSYDSDGGGVTLGVSYDPYGIAITYAGYLLLLVGIIATLLSRQTQMRSLYRKAITAVMLLMSLSAHADNHVQAVDEDIAHRIATIQTYYNNRICPLNTVATDFVTKLTGSASWNGYSADEIFISWMIYYSPWEHQKLIRIKSRDVQQILGIDDQWASYSDFLNEYHEYKLKDAIDALRQGNSPIDKKALTEADEKFQMVEMFYRGQFIRIFPYSIDGNVNWYTPGTQTLPREIPVKEQFFIKQSMDFLTESIVTGQHSRAQEIIEKIKLFQQSMIGPLLPNKSKTKAEIFYNTLRSQKWPVFLALTLSLLLCLLPSLERGKGVSLGVLVCWNGVLFLYVTLLLGLRWWLSGHVPVSNGHETMLFMAWAILLLCLLPSLGRGKGVGLIIGFGPLVASFCLLVSMLAGSNSQMTPLMPVLQSPLLSIHVMTVMCAYALFALQMLLGIQGIILSTSHFRKQRHEALERITAMSQFLLYPAVALLAIGIFLGAVWANVSWGNYWSWDPKESWALITLMVYAVPLHKATIRLFQKPLAYHIYMVCAFLAVLITYFGVNFLLGGMHSYA